jgi:AcrR family transcriptional regulator
MLEVVGLVGYESMSLGMVLGPARVSRRAFEAEFEGKEDCYLAAYDAAVEDVNTLLGEATKDESTWLGQLRVGLDALFCLLDSEPEVGRALLVEVHSVGAPAKTKLEDTLSRGAAFFDLARREPGVVFSPSEITARALASSVYGRLYSWLRRNTRNDARELLPELVHFAALPYFGADVARREMLAARSQLGRRAA